MWQTYGTFSIVGYFSDGLPLTGTGWMCVRAFLSSVRDPAAFHPVLISASPLYVEKWIGVQHIPVPSPCL